MKPYIAFGVLTIMEGDPGIGKSYVAMHLAAQISIGGSLPGIKKVYRGKVLYMSAEDDPSFTIRPRIDAMGGDATRVRYQAKYSALDDKGLKTLRREIRREHTALVIIDPLYAYVPAGSDMHRPNTIRALLSELNDIAKDNSTAMLAIRHLTKAKHDKAIYQGMGGIDVIAAARSALLVANHPDNPEIKVIAHIKHNLSKPGDSLQYRLRQDRDGEIPIVEWLGSTYLKADELLNLASAETKSALDEAADFIQDQLADGPKDAAKIFSAGERRSISKRTLERAKHQLGVRSTKIADGWQWELRPSKQK